MPGFCWSESFQADSAAYDPTAEAANVKMIDQILVRALEAGAGDVHLVPDAQSLRMYWRLDGVLHPVAVFPASAKTGLIARLKVISELLTYRTDMPQEGRIHSEHAAKFGGAEIRVSTFPTVHGEKAVVRLFIGSGQCRELDDLHLGEPVVERLRALLRETSGAVLITGPAGSGKTTTAYACLRDLTEVSAGSRSLVSLEDPVEALLPGVAQSQVNPHVGFDYAAGLRSLMRQDPDVILVGEIRDRTVAATVVQASLTGHLVLTTFHAGSSAEALVRLADMGIDGYLIRSGVRAVLCQRLVRRLCGCATWCDGDDLDTRLDIERHRTAIGCEQCGGSGYQGRMPLAELLLPGAERVAAAIREGRGAAAIQAAAEEVGMVSCRSAALEAVRAGRTSFAEICRVLGIEQTIPPT